MIHDEFLLKRYEGNPILTPKDFPGADGVRNCGQTMVGRETDTCIGLAAGSLSELVDACVKRV